MARDGKWMQAEKEREEKAGTAGKFGKATRKKIARGKKHGGKEKKRAILAETFKKMAARRKHKGRKSKTRKSSSRR